MTEHILDNPIWSALTTEHASLAEGGAKALRYPSAIGPLAAVRPQSAAGNAILRDWIESSGPLIIAQVEKFEIPEGLQVMWERRGIQMVANERHPCQPSEVQIEPLHASDASEMLDLALSTKPGPFAKRTHELGQFWGIRESGRLVAMAGERMRQTGYAEISAVCTHPDHRGRGFARLLSLKVLDEILRRGEIPYLHAFMDNQAAIRLYESIGFRPRSELNIMMLEPV